MCAAGNATRSGCNAAKVFGATSANIRITRVRRPAARAMPASPSRRNASTVASEDAAMFTKLFPRRIRPISLSGRSRSRLARRAPICPARARWRSRYRFRAIIPVSEPEKHAERMMRTTRAPISTPSGTSLKRGGPSRSADRHYGGADPVLSRGAARAGRQEEYQRRSSSTSRIQRLPKYASTSTANPPRHHRTAVCPRQP